MTNFKKVWIIILVISLTLVISASIWICYYENSFVEKNYTKYTGIENFEILKNIHNNYESYIVTKISNEDKKIITNRFGFENDLNKLKGRIQCPYIKQNLDYLYFIVEDGYGIYGYILFALKTDSNILEVYEFYGD